MAPFAPPATLLDYYRSVYHRWVESEKLTPNPDLKTPDPISLQILDSGSSPCSSLMLLYMFIRYKYTSA